MKRFYFAILASAFALSLGGGFVASAAPAVAKLNAPSMMSTRCRDKMGKFTKCPTPKPKPMKCRDKHGKFIKCNIKM